MPKEMSNHHPKRDIPTRNKKIFRNHVVNDESRNVNFNAFQKVIDGEEHIPWGDNILQIWEGDYRTRSGKELEP